MISKQSVVLLHIHHLPMTTKKGQGPVRPLRSQAKQAFESSPFLRPNPGRQILKSRGPWKLCPIPFIHIVLVLPSHKIIVRLVDKLSFIALPPSLRPFLFLHPPSLLAVCPILPPWPGPWPSGDSAPRRGGRGRRGGGGGRRMREGKPSLKPSSSASRHFLSPPLNQKPGGRGKKRESNRARAKKREERGARGGLHKAKHTCLAATVRFARQTAAGRRAKGKLALCRA